MENDIPRKSFINTVESKFGNRIHIKICKQEEHKTENVDRLITLCIGIDAGSDIGFGLHSLCYNVSVGKLKYKNVYFISDPFAYSGYRLQDEGFKNKFNLTDDESFISLNIKEWIMSYYFKSISGANMNEFHAFNADITFNGENTTVEKWFTPKSD